MRIDAPVAIAPAGRGDMRACARILNGWIDETEWMPRIHSHDAVENFYETVVFDERTVLVAKTGGDVVGFLAFQDQMVTALCVDREMRRRKVGQLLLDGAKRAMKPPISLWAFVKNAPARSFYRENGFTETARTEGDTEERLPDIRFTWSGMEGRGA